MNGITRMRIMLAASIALFLVSVCGSCAFVPGPVSPRTARSSTYKIKVDQEIDLDGEVKHIRSWGTAWIYSHEDGATQVMTAGHVCETDDELLTIIGDIPVLSVSYTIIGVDDDEHVTSVVLRDDDAIDLCMLEFKGHIGVALPIANADPAYGDEVTYVGAPRGHWGAGVAPMYRGTFSGRGLMFGEPESLVFGIHAAPGASGSAIMHSGRVAAVLTMGFTDHWQLISGVPWDVIRKFGQSVLAD